MKIAMIGTGYVGLVSGTCLADIGHNVICFDRLPDKIAQLQQGIPPIYEPGIAAVMARNMDAGRLGFTTDLATAVAGADAIFIAVGTPSRRGDGHADLSHVMTAARQIARALTGYAVIVTKSTVPVGTNRKLAQLIHRTHPGAQFDMVANPEFLREGVALHDFMHPDRVVIGSNSARAARVMYEIYRPLSRHGIPIHATDPESAELIKYASNAFLATKISFINDIAALCERVGADVASVARGMGLDARIGPDFLNAGPGFGGSCFPKDLSALVRIGRENGTPQRIPETVIAVNNRTKQRMIDKLRDLCGGSVNGKTITALGVTFKPDTDDMRDAPSLTLLPALMEQGASLRVVDPQGHKEGAALLPGVDWLSDPYAAAQRADCLLILTEWPQFRSLDLDRLARVMATPLMADLRNLFRPEQALAAGFVAYAGVGRAPIALPPQLGHIAAQ